MGTVPRLHAVFGKHSFHWVVLAKFVIQDIPQQVCIMLYLFGWYEASGLRCQLCLFEAEYCRYEAPFHFTNFVAFTCTLLSSCANQLLVNQFTRRHTPRTMCVCSTAFALAVLVSPCCHSQQLFVSPPGACFRRPHFCTSSWRYH